MPDIICGECKHEFNMSIQSIEEKTKLCPKCGSVASSGDTKLNPNFYKFVEVAIQEDLSVIQETFEYGVEVSIKKEGREIVFGWLDSIPKLINNSPRCTPERRRVVQKVCEYYQEKMMRKLNIIDAAYNGNLSEVVNCINSSIDVNQHNEKNETALFWAVCENHIEIVKYLISQGADVNSIRHDGATPLIMASQDGRNESVKLLLKNGANVMSQAEANYTALMMACKNGHINIAKMLIEKGSDLNAMTVLGQNPLTIARIHGHNNIIELLENSGAETYDLIGEGDLSIVKKLISSGADVNLKDFRGETALIHAINNGYLDVADFLIMNGVDVNSTTEHGIAHGLTPLMFSAEKGYKNLVSQLIEKGADVNATVNLGLTALMSAGDKGDVEIVKILIENGADVNAKTENGHTALLGSSYYVDVVNLLLSFGADVNAQADWGWTPLVCAIKDERIEVVKTLLDNNADTNIDISLKGKPAQTAIDYAKERGFEEIVLLLSAYSKKTKLEPSSKNIEDIETQLVGEKNDKKWWAFWK